MAKKKQCTKFGKRLETALREQGHNQTWLARSLGVAPATVSDWKTGSEPSFHTLCCIANALQVSVDYLLGMTDSKFLNLDDRQICDYTGLSDNAVIMLRLMKEMHDTDLLQSLSKIIESRRFAFAVNKFFRAEKEYNTAASAVFGENFDAEVNLLAAQKALWDIKDHYFQNIDSASQFKDQCNDEQEE